MAEKFTQMSTTLGLWKSLTPTPGRVRRRPTWTFVKAVEPGGLTGQLRHWKLVVHSYFPPYHKLLRGRFWQRNKREPSSRLFFRKSPESWSYTEMTYPLRQWETFALFYASNLRWGPSGLWRAIYLHPPTKRNRSPLLESQLHLSETPFLLRLQGCSVDDHSFSETVPEYITKRDIYLHCHQDANISPNSGSIFINFKCPEQSKWKKASWFSQN